MPDCGLPVPCDSVVFAPNAAALAVTNEGADGIAIRAHAPTGFGTAVEAAGVGGPAIVATSDSGSGVTASSVSASGIRGVSGTGNGVNGNSQSATGVAGTSETSTGVLGTSKTAVGVIGRSGAETGSVFPVGVVGECDPNIGVFGNGRVGVFGVADLAGVGVLGRATSGPAVLGDALPSSGFVSVGVEGVSSAQQQGPTLNVGVRGFARNSRSLNAGVVAVATQSPDAGPAIGLSAAASAGSDSVAVHARAKAGLAGLFEGDVHINGFLFKSGGAFRIDHPLDPENKYLSHGFVESHELKNLYDGVVTLDDKGEATIELPSWMQVINTDVRYQLCPVGAAAPNLHVAREMSGNQFTIAGGAPGLRVCWQLTGRRQDAWARAHPFSPESDKPASERGYYLHPELYAQPEENSTFWKGNNQLLRIYDPGEEVPPSTQELTERLKALRESLSNPRRDDDTQGTNTLPRR